MKMILNDGTFYDVDDVNEETIKVGVYESASTLRRIVSVTIIDEGLDLGYMEGILTDENLKEVTFQGSSGSIKKNNLTLDSTSDRLTDEGRIVVLRLKYLS